MSEYGCAAAFGRQDVAVAGAYDLVAHAALGGQRNLIAHGSRGQEECGFFAQQGSDPGCQRIDTGILAALFVADRGVEHRFAHAPGGAGCGITDQINP